MKRRREKRTSERQPRYYRCVIIIIFQLHSNRAYIEEIEHKNKLEISEVEKEFRKNKDNVIEYLFNHVIKVDIIVPDVVKGKFEEKFGVQS